MYLNISSRILINLLFNNIDKFFISKYKNPKIAISPIMPYNHEYCNYDHIVNIIIKSPFRDFSISILTKNLPSDDLKNLKNYIQSNIYQTEIIFSILFKDKYKIRITPDTEESNSEYYNSDKRRIDLSVKNKKSEHIFSILIPIKLLRLFSKRIKPDTKPEAIDDEIRNFFKNPVNIFPNLKMILETFSDIELQNLLNQLQKRNLLTIYQICLVVLSFPEKSLRLKNNLSTNTICDVMKVMKRIRKSGEINKRDLIGGIYSIEEAIFFMMKGRADFSYSVFLSDTQKILEMLSNIEILLLKDFKLWIEEIMENGLLYKTISNTDESIIAKSISAEWERYENILKEHISERRIKAIYSSIKNGKTSFIDRISAQSNMIYNYRKLKSKRLNLGDESFEYLLRRFTRPYDHSNLLFNVGWFVLSTALKGIKIKKMEKLLSNIPRPARYLIEDVLRGVINPNIIQDEIQIKRARSICVKAIMSLYEEGVIHLSD